jgi:hypothetical protein
VKPIALAVAACVAVHAHADYIAYDESTSGDASDDRLAPTFVQLGGGRNVIRGTFGQSTVPGEYDLDYITIAVPDGHQLSAFVLEDAFVGGAFSFVAIQAGPIVTIPADWTSIDTPLLGWAHFGTAEVGQDLLPVMGSSPGSVGFRGALPAGTYALWIMELNDSEPYSYSFGLEVTAIPAPGALMLAGASMLQAAFRRRRPRR